ncbi:hypothetical protein LPB67_16015 [Undibacterium sp. Jales W-56]|uniref:hypothetical protein n=1 Tax=Undibacterium sp. Jales W-56 TaxID=2897325 RepID=UPI0021D322A2|nr:hypothetical protein [Undibacterium sp. Jales W-56]MCU6435282.1 hypothetical protein [Undibacterium sp. Jales W-56]
MLKKEYIYRVLAIFAILNLLCIFSIYMGTVVGFQFWPGVVAWLVIGFFVTARNGGPAKFSSGTKIDLLGATKLLWSLALWPRLT